MAVPEFVSDAPKYPTGAVHGHLYKPMDKLQCVLLGTEFHNLSYL